MSVARGSRRLRHKRGKRPKVDATAARATRAWRGRPLVSSYAATDTGTAVAAAGGG
jgi:hypothetical protein